MQVIDVTKSAVAQSRKLKGVRGFTILGILLLVLSLNMVSQAKSSPALSFAILGVAYIVASRLMKRGRRVVALLCAVFYFISGWVVLRIVFIEMGSFSALIQFIIIVVIGFFIVQGVYGAFSSVTLCKTLPMRLRLSLSQRLLNPRKAVIIASWGFLSAVIFAGGVLLLARYVRLIHSLIPFFFELRRQSWGIEMLFVIAGFSIIGLSLHPYTRAKRYLSASAAEVRALDKRPPILFLRSFKDDTIKAKEFRFHYFRPPEGISRSFEEVLTQHLWDYGPVIAIGMPGESAPPLGAAREYITNDNWRSRIQELSASAQMILLIAGDTAGLLSEVRMITGAELLSRTVLVFPPKKEELLLRLLCVCKELEDVDLPTWTTLLHSALPSLPLLILPCKPEPVCIVGKRRFSSYYRKAMDAAVDLVLAKHCA